MQWIPELELLSQEIGEKSVGYRVMHVKAAQRGGRIYTTLMYAGMFIGPLGGLFSSLGTLQWFEDLQPALPVLSACTGFASGILIAAVKFGKWEEHVESHKRAAAQYTSLESNVRRTLAVPRVHRIEPVKYTEWLGKSFDDLFQSSPLIPSDIFNKYCSDAKKAGITIPDEYAISVTVDQAYPKSILAPAHTIVIHTEEEPKPSGKPDGRSRPKLMIPEHNKFDAGNMEYEMHRLMKS